MWLELEGLNNLRDLGGTPTRSRRRIRRNTLWRSDNLQDLGPAQFDQLREWGLTDVIDLRTDFEIESAPSPAEDLPGITYHHCSYFREDEDDDEDILDRALPWVDYEASVRHEDPVTASYLSFLRDRPDSVVEALEAITDAEGAALVQCAAGKDRTGFTIALVLSLLGVSDADIVADYARTTERITAVVQRMWSTETYASERDRELSQSALAARPEAMQGVLDYLNREKGGVEPALVEIGWAHEDTLRLRKRLLES
ncbi:tyrosine-protein phosphatase [Nigerium massiliense]|uniref:tyrosine-protein phosphatase n=1 Tax=Nigerium massiliense TaxID=1522317 RepID=UPI00058DDA62|nr:tyrosine-protein phosphatase [Nigerium massiliense]